MPPSTQNPEAVKLPDPRRLDASAKAAALRLHTDRREMRRYGGLQYDEAGRPIFPQDPGLVRRARRLLFGD
jgi:hypothetical protein